MDYDEAVEKAKETQSKDRAWVIGDLANELEPKYGEQTIRQFSQDIDEHYDSVLAYRAVAQAFEPLKRFSDPISWSHHRVVYALPEKERIELLKTASKKKWSVKTLREVINPPKEPEPQCVIRARSLTVYLNSEIVRIYKEFDYQDMVSLLEYKTARDENAGKKIRDDLYKTVEEAIDCFYDLRKKILNE